MKNTTRTAQEMRSLITSVLYQEMASGKSNFEKTDFLRVIQQVNSAKTGDELCIETETKLDKNILDYAIIEATKHLFATIEKTKKVINETRRALFEIA